MDPRSVRVPDIELIWDADCPNVAPARDLLRAALDQLGLEPSWSEHEIGTDSAERHGGYGSPSILVDGQDVAGAAPSGDSDCCRIYRDVGGRFRGVPELAQVVDALAASLARTSI